MTLSLILQQILINKIFQSTFNPKLKANDQKA